MRVMICCGMAVQRMGMLGGECEEDEGTENEDGNSDIDWYR